TLPVTMPVILSYGYTGRDTGFWNEHYQVPFFGSLLNFSNPFLLPHFLAFTRLDTVTGPYFYLAWFVMPLAIMIDWKKIAFKKEFYSMGLFAFLFFLFALGPKQMGPLRWRVRFVLFFLVVFLLMFLLTIEPALFVTADRRKLWVGGFWLL